MMPAGKLEIACSMSFLDRTWAAKKSKCFAKPFKSARAAKNSALPRIQILAKNEPSGLCAYGGLSVQTSQPLDKSINSFNPKRSAQMDWLASFLRAHRHKTFRATSLGQSLLRIARGAILMLQGIPQEHGHKRLLHRGQAGEIGRERGNR